MRHVTTALRRAKPAAAALLGLLALAGCASAAADRAALDGEPRPLSRQITVASEPTGARCVLANTADNARVAEITTPARLPLPRSIAIIEARCPAPGRMDTTLAIRSVRDFAADIHPPAADRPRRGAERDRHPQRLDPPA